jgi:hypothetical protein
MKKMTGFDFAYQDTWRFKHLGDLAAGPVTVRQIYAAFPYQQRIVKLSVKGSDLGQCFLDKARAQGMIIEPQRQYTIAVTSMDVPGRIKRIGGGPYQRQYADMEQRDLIFRYIKEYGFEVQAGGGPCWSGAGFITTPLRWNCAPRPDRSSSATSRCAVASTQSRWDGTAARITYM